MVAKDYQYAYWHAQRGFRSMNLNDTHPDANREAAGQGTK
jgi:hypothetical protein